mgnify:FL=1
MTIPFCGDKIAPVADDGALKAAGNQVSRRRGGGTAGGRRAEDEEPEALKKQMKKTVDNALLM